MKIQTARFGELDILESEVYVFQEGIPGFEQEKDYVLVDIDGHQPFSYLQSVNNPEMVFIVVDPFEFFGDYEFDLSDKVVKELQIEDKSQILVRTIVNAHNGIKTATANLIAPIVLNSSFKRGQQVILTQREYSTRHSLFVSEKEE